MKFKKLKGVWLPLSIISGLILSACSGLSEANNPTKVNYVAIGDSVAAGYNADLGGLETSGNFNQSTNAVNGWSYPSFLAHYINQNSVEKLEDYTNLAISGARTTDWLHFLNKTPEGYDVKSRSDYFNFVQKTNADLNSPFKDRLPKYFGDFSTGQYNKILEKVQNADLITVSLAANDFFAEIPLTDLADTSNLPSLYLKLGSTNRKIIKSYEDLIARIKELNPKARIVLTGYPMPLIRISNALNNLVNNLALGGGTSSSSGSRSIGFNIGSILSSFLKDKEATQYILNLVNQTIIKDVAKKANVDWINVDDPNDWNKNATVYAHNLFDIHPTMYGHKKMAQDIFLKLTLKQDSEADAQVKNWNTLNPLWDEQYLRTDVKGFKQFLHSDLDERDLVRTVAGVPGQTTIKTQTPLENNPALVDVFNLNKRGSSFVTLVKTGGYNLYDKLFKVWMGLETETTWNSFLGSNGTYRNFATWLVSHPDLTDLLVTNLEHSLDKYGDQRLTNENLKDGFHLLNAKTLNAKSLTTILVAMKNLLNSNFFKNDTSHNFSNAFKKNGAINKYLTRNIKNQFVEFFTAFNAALLELHSTTGTNHTELQTNGSNAKLSEYQKASNLDDKIADWIEKVATDLFTDSTKSQYMNASSTADLVKQWSEKNVTLLKNFYTSFSTTSGGTTTTSASVTATAPVAATQTASK
ncbi:lysophospholipase L1-like esterase [Mycoplasmoides fastidiosum]|uniref:Lysophospholipase L1-like esterase n=1 Tax=Mycoplasmoides fastidiosum TaxID=92758 RepID=A0ABU0LYD3_9BACT|nr:GDSL-type esterase/lipase family protein [Mycoplasmoides fastidiosum]MDQ0513700.1 lysophospholipase L1-like esterase [Mycoplasmoides fastidiosum]UUD37877.1 GDSL-type esterase/lipase family protein [Mycoplasmoides fastidiosum]